MAFQEVNSLDADVTIALGKVDKTTGKPFPKEIEGYYLGSRSVANKRGDSKLHFFQTAKGNVGVWGTTDLDRKLGQVTVGSMTRATSTGTKPTPNGDMYTYRVEVDKDNSIQVQNSSTEENTASSLSESYAEDSEDDNDDDEVQALALAAAEKKARVEALLKGNRKAVSK
jgi:hypothetical protein